MPANIVMIHMPGGRDQENASSLMQSAAADEWAHIAVPAVRHPLCPAVLAPAHMSPSTVAAGFTACSLTYINLSRAVPLAYFPLSTVHGHVFFPLSTVLPRSMFALGLDMQRHPLKNTHRHK